MGYIQYQMKNAYHFFELYWHVITVINYHRNKLATDARDAEMLLKAKPESGTA